MQALLNLISESSRRALRRVDMQKQQRAEKKYRELTFTINRYCPLQQSFDVKHRQVVVVIVTALGTTSVDVATVAVSLFSSSLKNDTRL